MIDKQKAPRVLTDSNYKDFEYPGRFQTNVAGTGQALQRTLAHSFVNKGLLKSHLSESHKEVVRTGRCLYSCC